MPRCVNNPERLTFHTGYYIAKHSHFTGAGLPAKFASEIVRFNPYAVKKLGLLQSQTLLKIEDYMLICAPYQLSMAKIILLVILTPEEINFFQQFRSRLASLTIAFQKQPAKTPMNLLLRGSLERIGPVKGKTNVCLMEIVYKSCPAELVEIIGDYVLSGLKTSSRTGTA
jgi:hypothetical protein